MLCCKRSVWLAALLHNGTPASAGSAKCCAPPAHLALCHTCAVAGPHDKEIDSWRCGSCSRAPSLFLTVCFCLLMYCPLPQKEKKRLERELRETDAKLTGDGGFEDRMLKAVRCCHCYCIVFCCRWQCMEV